AKEVRSGGDAVGEVFASSSGIVLRNPTRNGLLSLFKMRVPCMCKEQANLPCFLQVHGFSYTGSSSPTWDTDDWPAISSDEEDEHTVPERINLRVDSLTIDVGNGIEVVLGNVHFLNLENLDVRTQGWKTTWSLVSRLLRDSKKLKVLRIRRGFSGCWSQIESDFLPALENLHVDWTLIPCIAQAADFTQIHRVTLFIHKYDADHAREEEYENARPILAHGHWREVVFIEKPFWKHPEAPAGRAQRRAQLVAKLGLQWWPTFG
ncbi:hypothetical protein K525DRAFT_213858, partial [Schizophyllum commune Loenen D]